YTYIIDLETSLDDIWKAIDDKTRNSITKAEKDGITVKAGNDFARAFDLVEKSFARQKKTIGFKSTAFNYHDSLKTGGQCRTFIARDRYHDDIATVYIVWGKRRSYNLLNGYDWQKSHQGALALAMWEVIKFSKEMGLNEFDFEGSMIQSL
ncbi:GNAT family N-acetyltransferase, partial [Chloroflexota bacterium]